MIVRVAHHRYPSEERRSAAELNSAGRVRPAVACQPGFHATYYGRCGHLEAYSIAVWEDLASGEAGGAYMNSRPLLRGQTPEVLPTPDAVTFYDVVSTIVRDRVPAAGRLSYLRLADGQTSETADDWNRTAFAPMLEGIADVCQAYVLRSLDSDERVALTFWQSAEAMAAGGQAIGAWQDAELRAGRAPAYDTVKAIELSDLGSAIAAVPSTMPVHEA